MGGCSKCTGEKGPASQGAGLAAHARRCNRRRKVQGRGKACAAVIPGSEQGRAEAHVEGKESVQGILWAVQGGEKRGKMGRGAQQRVKTGQLCMSK